MTINTIEHLENIKIFTDYINSGLDSVEMFWMQIDKADSGKNKKVMKFDTNDYDPTEEELEQLLDDRKRKEHFDLSEEYTKVISDKILTKLEYDKATIPEKIELSELYEKIIEENGNLQEFLNTSKDIVDQYAKIIDHDLAEDFFKRLSDFEKSGKLKLNKLRVNKSESDSNESTMHKKVESAFSFMLNEDPRKHKKILSDDDFEKLIGWLTHYFENNFTLPEIKKPITEVNTAKGNVITTFKKFFKNEFPEKTYPNSLFNLYKASFFDFRNDDIKNIKKTSEPEYYKYLIAKTQ